MIASPPGLRSRLVGIGATAIVLAAALTVLMAEVKHETGVVAATTQQSAAGADLYLKTNELDLNLTEILLLDDSPALAPQKLNATSGYQMDSDAIDADLRPAGAGAAVRQSLTAYRTQAAVAKAAPTRAAGLSAYDNATGLAHRSLLPAAQSVSTATAERMTTAVRHERVLHWAGIAVVVLLGLALLAQVLILQAKALGRRLRAPLVTAAVVTVALMAASITVLQLGDTRLRAGHDDLAAALAGERAEGLGYDVVADPARYLITGKDREWPADATRSDRQIRKSVGGGAWIAWDVFDNSLTGIFTGIDQGAIKPADVSLYHPDTGTASEFVAFKNADFASAENLYTASQHRLSTARQLDVFRIVIPIVALVLALFLLALLVLRPVRSTVPPSG